MAKPKTTKRPPKRGFRFIGAYVPLTTWNKLEAACKRERRTRSDEINLALEARYADPVSLPDELREYVSLAKTEA